VLQILKKYPLLTTRKKCQLAFALKYMDKKDLENFYLDRENKYKDQIKFTVKDTSVFPFYWKGWLSGFIEAEGHFKLRYLSTGGIQNWGFQIGQNNDSFLLEMIQKYLKSSHKISCDSNKKHFRVSIYGPICREILFQHFLQYPLLGEKKISYEKWIKPFQK
jgi:hypothetical protein